MSAALFEFARSFVVGRLSAEIFSSAYMELWKIERDRGFLQKDDSELNEKLSSIFCLADLYNPDPDREGYELDEESLRIKITQIVG
ncbi:colicin immunity domain-containing protein [Chitiniphilus eburneus]|uniref:Colicin immunity protein n=1 Tax=Chitiniphilus eburneus TaxID=2571148 RepID=A0A4U0PCY0_9NEIS|nr:colicin immunity domain-containing protein [Chitiniphilus eburneus]TJZ65617.1 colicin immunity protein [Chitiniphilus eburneus]